MVSSEGGPFFAPDVRKDVERIEAFYLDRGVRGTKTVSEFKPIAASSFSVIITVNEGRRVRIGDIVIIGNKVTRKKTILREVRLKAGRRGVPGTHPGNQEETRGPRHLLRGQGR